MTRFGIKDTIARGLAAAATAGGLGTASLTSKEPEALPFCALSYALVGIFSTLIMSIPAVQVRGGGGLGWGGVVGALGWLVVGLGLGVGAYRKRPSAGLSKKKGGRRCLCGVCLTQRAGPDSSFSVWSPSCGAHSSLPMPRPPPPQPRLPQNTTRRHWQSASWDKQSCEAAAEFFASHCSPSVWFLCACVRALVQRCLHAHPSFECSCFWRLAAGGWPLWRAPSRAQHAAGLDLVVLLHLAFLSRGLSIHYPIPYHPTLVLSSPPNPIRFRFRSLV